MSKHGKLKIIPLGGLGEVGNMTAYEFNHEILIVDAGIMFPHNDMIGIDYIIPDYEYLKKRAGQVVGMVITHGHEDHIGAIPFLLREFPLPIYATTLTLALIREKLKEQDLFDRCQIMQIAARESFSIGPFRVEFLQVCHSIPDGVGLAISTPAGILIHSGDFKIDQTPIDAKRFD